jgi:predicted PurR-regulated permease PerM
MSTPEQRLAIDRARASWAALGDRLRTVTPAALGRTVLTVLVIATIVAFSAATWPTLLPFVVGALLAYAVLPVVDALDRVMPRGLAAVTAMLGAVAVLVGALVIVIPPLTSSLLQLAGQLPAGSALQDAIDEALAGLPQEARDVVVPIIISAAEAIRGGIDSTSGDLDGIVATVFRAALGVVGAVLGLLVLPAWLLTVLSDKHVARRTLDRRLAGWLRPDAWAVIRLADRSAGVYLRGFVVLAFAVGAATFVGLELSPRLGGPTFGSPLALATLAGLVQLVPELGAVLGLLPALLLLAVDPERAVTYVAAYVVARLLVGRLIGSRRGTHLHVHPGILIPGVVVLGQIGPLWLLLSAPILSFLADFVRYVHGRLSEPPRPAGVLPGESLPTPASASARPAPVPVVYRRHRPGPPDLLPSPEPVTR